MDRARKVGLERKHWDLPGADPVGMEDGKWEKRKRTWIFLDNLRGESSEEAVRDGQNSRAVEQ